jgi:hypothetical protein
MNSLVISTLPHYLAIIPIIWKFDISLIYTIYAYTIFLSSTFSVLYHNYDESNKVITFIDYMLAYLWFSEELLISYIYTNYTTLAKILLLNLFIFIWNINIPKHDYKRQHSIWHIFSALKAIYISYLLNPT